MEPGIAILLCVVALVLGAGVSGFICFKQGISYRKKTAEAAVGSAEKEAERIVDQYLVPCIAFLLLRKYGYPYFVRKKRMKKRYPPDIKL